MSECPTEEMIANYVDGACSHEEKEQLLKHLTSCKTCAIEYILSLELRDLEEDDLLLSLSEEKEKKAYELIQNVKDSNLSEYSEQKSKEKDKPQTRLTNIIAGLLSVGALKEIFSRLSPVPALSYYSHEDDEKSSTFQYEKNNLDDFLKTSGKDERIPDELPSYDDRSGYNDESNDLDSFIERTEKIISSEVEDTETKKHGEDFLPPKEDPSFPESDKFDTELTDENLTSDATMPSWEDMFEEKHHDDKTDDAPLDDNSDDDDF
jgi:hypothetical protein